MRELTTMSNSENSYTYTPAERAPAVAAPAAFISIPGSIVKAIAAVQSHVDAIAKKNVNQFGKYKYVSADDIYAHLTNKLAEIGLVILPIEITPVETKMVETSKGPKQHAKFHYGFVLCVGDDTYFDPRLSRSMFIEVTGSQTYQAAESYLQKTFLRGLFKIPTGDLDLDSIPSTEDVEKEQAAAKKRGKKVALLSAEDSAKKAKEILAHITSLNRPMQPEDEKDFVEKYGADLNTLQESDKAEVRGLYAEWRKAE